MPSVIYGFPASDWDCEKCHSRNAATDQTCHHCNARRFPQAASLEPGTTTRMYREPREVGINAMPILTVVLCVCTIIAICALLYMLLG